MSIALLAGPVVGALIGYCTNYIAVKMMFRPLHPVKVFGKTLPFTPGIIPKGKTRIAQSIGSAVGENLLTQETLEKNLLSKEVTDKLETKINGKLKAMETDDRSVKDVITFYVEEEKFYDSLDKGEAFVADKLCEKISEMDVGNMVAEEAVRAIKENVIGTLVAKLLSDEFLYSMAAPIAEKVDEMVKERSSEIIKEKIHFEFENFQEKTVGELFTTLDSTGFNVGEMVVTAYKVLITKKLKSILQGINITQIVQDKIDTMDVYEVEELVLQVMKKELNAIVNLGAVIGFVLGCINILFNL